MSEKIINKNGKIFSSCCKAPIHHQSYTTVGSRIVGNMLILFCSCCGILFDGNGYELKSTDPKYK